MVLPDLIARLRASPRFMRDVTAWERLPARPARFGPWPLGFDDRLKEAARARGVDRLYAHQVLAVEAALRGENVVVVTGTASGKTLCYNLPVLNAFIRDRAARALYLFPTKALAQDQLNNLRTEFAAIDTDAFTYDGDTPRSQRAAVRRGARLLITNPDMLHAGILPHHTQWESFLGNLRYVIIDEMHSYRGVFGSHVANLMRRLRRLCAFYGAAPQFLLTSATIANPTELAQRLIEGPVSLVDDDGSPRGEKHFVFLNPPVVDADLGIRRSVALQTHDVVTRLLNADVQTIVFTRARMAVEELLDYLRDEAAIIDIELNRVRGYRGGYLPLERREIEKGLREGTVQAVVATNALELGVDIGQLSACVMSGYPGTIASTWQQAGRAGRRTGVSVAVLVASAAPLDQFMVRHPEYFFGRSPERGLIQPDNLVILLDHLRCAAFELPFQVGEGFGRFDNVPALLDYLAQQEHTLHRSNGSYHWIGEGYPAANVSLRSSGSDSVLIIDDSDGEGIVIGHVDRPRAPAMVHDGAIYMHQGQTYVVQRLDWEAGHAHVHRTNVDYFTFSRSSHHMQVLEEHERSDPMQADQGGSERTELDSDAAARPARRQYGSAYGELQVTSTVVGYRQVKRYTHETLGFEDVDMPEQTTITSGAWLWVGEEALDQLHDEGVLLPPIDYGPNWPAQREQARQRDQYRCRTCNAPEREDRKHDVHHITPFREFGYVPGENEAYLRANELDNLITLCSVCHRRAETARHVRGALSGLAHALQQLAPLYLMCDPRDLGCAVESHSAHTGLPTITLYDEAQGGIGLCVQLYDVFGDLLRASRDLVTECGCQSGCPSCVGPAEDLVSDTKQKVMRLLEVLLESQSAPAQ